MHRRAPAPPPRRPVRPGRVSPARAVPLGVLRPPYVANGGIPSSRALTPITTAEELDRMRAAVNLRHVPVIVLSNKFLGLEDVKRIENHARVTLQSKGIWSNEETVFALNRAILGVETLPAHTSALVKQAIAYLHQNYTRTVSRWEIAEAVGVSEDYLSRVFARELGISPWDYLNRYRILQAKQLLADTTESVGSIARRVGFKDQAYFSRVFHKVMRMSPQEFREGM